MACRIILVRHGQSVGNVKSVFCGYEDVDLSNLGYNQAEKTCEYLQNVKIDKIYSSDLIRAYNTAKPLSTSKNLPIIKSEKLREIFAGEWGGKSVQTLLSDYCEDYSVWLKNIGLSKPKNGESVVELQKRIVEEIFRIARESEGKTVAVFTHATPIRVLFAHIRGAKPEEIKDIPWVNNASVSEVLVEDGKMSEIFYGYDDFMGKMSSGLPKNM